MSRLPAPEKTAELSAGASRASMGVRALNGLTAWLAGWWRVLYLGAQIMVLAVSPSSYGPANRLLLARHVVLATAPILLWFTLLCALATLVITRIVVVTAISYGLSQYALQLIIRVLVLELIPLGAALFVALRSTIASSAELAEMRLRGELQALADPLRQEAMPRVVAGMFASITLAALSCVVALVLAYLAVYGFTLSALPAYTRLFGQVFNPAVTLIFVLKTLFFSLAVALMPIASALYDEAPAGMRHGAELRALARMFVVILLIEMVSLVGNYY
jgi:phospholipid/cholesterol/gamma-HCH transport system permease protein